MNHRTIDFWFAIGSTYTYLSVMRLSQVAKQHDVTFRWHPFSLRTLTREMNNIPFATKPFKAAYMWQDLKRRAAMHGIAAEVPAPYPLREFDLANQVATVGMIEGWGEDYVRGTYRRWFVNGQEPGSEPNLSDSIREAGQDPARVLDRARADDIVERYTGETDAARSKGVFGSPTYLVDDQVFWGDDRLEDAVSWRLHGHVQRL